MGAVGRYQTKEYEMGKTGYNEGDIGWQQLNTESAESTLGFYVGVFGWEKKGEPMPGYHVFGKGDEMLGGITTPAEGQGGKGWIPYVTVTDLDATLVKVNSEGGKVLTGPNSLPDGGRMAIIADPSGNATGVAQYAQVPSGS
jgi:uncharacterized protein